MWTWKRIGEHLLFWVFYWLLISLSSGMYDYDFVNVGLYNLSRLPLTAVCTYIFVYKILPYFLVKKQIFVFSFLSLGLLLTTLLLDRISVKYIQFPLFYANTPWTFQFFDAYRLVSHGVHLITTAGIVASFKYYRDWKREQQQVLLLNEEKRNAELRFLKAQVHPHFLFNALNAIYFESSQGSAKAAELILGLSGILRFNLDASGHVFFPLERELELMDDYIALQESRFGERIEVVWEKRNTLPVKIPPLLCFSLLENAFKHGVSERTGKSTICISLNCEENHLFFRVVNPMPLDQAQDRHGARDGIGLKNTKRQLELIFGQGFSLESAVVDGQFQSEIQFPVEL